MSHVAHQATSFYEMQMQNTLPPIHQSARRQLFSTQRRDIISESQSDTQLYPRSLLLPPISGVSSSPTPQAKDKSSYRTPAAALIEDEIKMLDQRVANTMSQLTILLSGDDDQYYQTSPPPLKSLYKSRSSHPAPLNRANNPSSKHKKSVGDNVSPFKSSSPTLRSSEADNETLLRQRYVKQLEQCAKLADKYTKIIEANKKQMQETNTEARSSNDAARTPSPIKTIKPRNNAKRTIQSVIAEWQVMVDEKEAERRVQAGERVRPINEEDEEQNDQTAFERLELRRINRARERLGLKPLDTDGDAGHSGAKLKLNLFLSNEAEQEDQDKIIFMTGTEEQKQMRMREIEKRIASNVLKEHLIGNDSPTDRELDVDTKGGKGPPTSTLHEFLKKVDEIEGGGGSKPSSPPTSNGAQPKPSTSKGLSSLLADKEAQRQKALETVHLLTHRHWKLAKGQTIDVLPQPRLTSVVLKTLTGELILKELEVRRGDEAVGNGGLLGTKARGDTNNDASSAKNPNKSNENQPPNANAAHAQTLWVRIEEGWVAAELAVPSVRHEAVMRLVKEASRWQGGIGGTDTEKTAFSDGSSSPRHKSTLLSSPLKKDKPTEFELIRQLTPLAVQPLHDVSIATLLQEVVDKRGDQIQKAIAHCPPETLTRYEYFHASPTLPNDRKGVATNEKEQRIRKREDELFRRQQLRDQSFGHAEVIRQTWEAMGGYNPAMDDDLLDDLMVPDIPLGLEGTIDDMDIAPNEGIYTEGPEGGEGKSPTRLSVAVSGRKSTVSSNQQYSTEGIHFQSEMEDLTFAADALKDIHVGY